MENEILIMMSASLLMLAYLILYNLHVVRRRKIHDRIIYLRLMALEHKAKYPNADITELHNYYGKTLDEVNETIDKG